MRRNEEQGHQEQSLHLRARDPLVPPRQHGGHPGGGARHTELASAPAGQGLPGNLGENFGVVLPDRPCASSTFLAEDPTTPLRLTVTVRRLRQQSIYEEKQERAEFRASSLSFLSKTLEAYIR